MAKNIKTNIKLAMIVLVDSGLPLVKYSTSKGIIETPLIVIKKSEEPPKLELDKIIAEKLPIEIFNRFHCNVLKTWRNRSKNYTNNIRHKSKRLIRNKKGRR